MAYTPRTIKDRVAVGDDIFQVEDLGNNRIRLIPAPTHVSEAGTPVNKALLQPIEDALGAITQKLSGIEEGAQVNTVTSVAGKTGAVTLTKSDVGLGSVQNYGIATKVQAEAGTANNVYMTPLRVKEAIASLGSNVKTLTGFFTGTGGTAVRYITIGVPFKLLIILTRNSNQTSIIFPKSQGDSPFFSASTGVSPGSGGCDQLHRNTSYAIWAYSDMQVRVYNGSDGTASHGTNKLGETYHYIAFY